MSSEEKEFLAILHEVLTQNSQASQSQLSVSPSDIVLLNSLKEIPKQSDSIDKITVLNTALNVANTRLQPTPLSQAMQGPAQQFQQDFRRSVSPTPATRPATPSGPNQGSSNAEQALFQGLNTVLRAQFPSVALSTGFQKVMKTLQPSLSRPQPAPADAQEARVHAEANRLAANAQTALEHQSALQAAKALLAQNALERQRTADENAENFRTDPDAGTENPEMTRQNSTPFSTRPQPKGFPK